MFSSPSLAGLSKSIGYSKNRIDVYRNHKEQAKARKNRF